MKYFKLCSIQKSKEKSTLWVTRYNGLTLYYSESDSFTEAEADEYLKTGSYYAVEVAESYAHSKDSDSVLKDGILIGLTYVFAIAMICCAIFLKK